MKFPLVTPIFLVRKKIQTTNQLDIALGIPGGEDFGSGEPGLVARSMC